MSQLTVLSLFSPDDELLATVLVNNDELDDAVSQIKETAPDVRIDEFIPSSFSETLEYLRDDYAADDRNRD